MMPKILYGKSPSTGAEQGCPGSASSAAHPQQCTSSLQLSSVPTSPCLTAPGAFLNPPQRTFYWIYFPTEKKPAQSRYFSKTKVFFLRGKGKFLLHVQSTSKSPKRKVVFKPFFSSLDSKEKKTKPKWNALTPEAKFAKRNNLKNTVEWEWRGKYCGKN